MGQRDVNAEGLEKSFATNVLGESEQWWRGKDGDGDEDLILFPTRSLHSHQESHPPAGEERRPQSGESDLPISKLYSRKGRCIFNGSSLHPVKESKQPAFIGRFLWRPVDFWVGLDMNK